MNLDFEEGKKAVLYARSFVDNFVRKKKLPTVNPKGVFKEKYGAFVTIHTYPDHDLRGCIGIPLPIMPLIDAIKDGAKSATRDPRFPPLGEDELDDIVVEVTILSKPDVIEVDNPKDYLKKIKIGRDGLIVEQGFNKGLLLPQVPVEQGWDKEEFLSNTCIKAGLMPDAWVDKNTKISKFSGKVFTENKPREEIMEKRLDGSKC